MRPRPNITHLRILVWLLIPFLLWLALRGIPFSDIANTLSQLTPGNLLILVAINLFILLMFSGRWWLLLRAQGLRIPYISLIKYRMASFGLTYFTPGPQFGGEPLQAFLLSRHSKVNGDTAVASVILDKLLEVLVNIVFILVGLAIMITSGLKIGISADQFLIGVVGLLAVPTGYLLLLCNGRLVITWMLSRITSNHLKDIRSNKFFQVIQGAETKVSQLCRSHSGTVLFALLFSFTIWLVIIFEYWVAFQLLGLNLDLSKTIILLTAARLAYFTPLPAGLGSLEASQVLAMNALGLPPAMGIGISLLVRTRDVLLASIGLWFIAYFTQKTIKEPLVSHIGD